MDSSKNKNNSKDKDIVGKERRSLLKKAVYTAPSLLALGTLSRPTKSMAGDSNIPEGPTWSGQGN